MQESQAITRKSASNLALAFVLLPRAQREAMATLYAFCREVDDVADEDSVPLEQRRRGLAEWRADLRCAFDGGTPRFAVNRELQPFLSRYHLAFEYFDALIQGMEMDLETTRYEDFKALELYCYRAASVVGLLSIEIFGCTQPACRDYAVYLGKALQLTNILRDVRNDAERGRIYLPQTELRRFGVSNEEILRFEYSERYAALARKVDERARHFFRLAQQSLPAPDRRSLIAAELMGAVYWGLLRRIEARQFNVLGPDRVSLSKAHKLGLILRTACRIKLGLARPNYGF